VFACCENCSVAWLICGSYCCGTQAETRAKSAAMILL
jgi:hypothetical protein